MPAQRASAAPFGTTGPGVTVCHDLACVWGYATGPQASPCASGEHTTVLYREGRGALRHKFTKSSITAVPMHTTVSAPPQ